MSRDPITPAEIERAGDEAVRDLERKNATLIASLERVTLRCAGLAGELIDERRRHASYFVQPLGQVFAERDRLRRELAEMRAQCERNILRAGESAEKSARLDAEVKSLAAELERTREAVRAIPDYAGRENRFCTEGESAFWDRAEWNTIREINCRVHPDGAEAMDVFLVWWEANKKGWLGPHRAYGAWLADELRRLGCGSQDLADAMVLLRTIPADVIYTGDWTRRRDALLTKHGGA